ncbi:hypothetical protein [Pacificoceanicola onchidii]|uniref:hypothetical protein n=1 Tax=Pacificoceanicola onchidii TaxID=2562685 RepID=UPI0010A34A82|nr:hypothetical protein [Pacificoceanicola onchidii]
MTGSETGDFQSKRDRVRVLLIQPLERRGFRFRKGVTAEQGRGMLDQICDDLAYLSDDALRALVASMATKGEGASKDFWPSRAAFLGIAESFERRPLVEHPNLLRWFASAAGRAALEGDRLVAEYQFWEAKKFPPVKPEHQAAVQARAAEHRDKRKKIEDRQERGMPPRWPDDLQWLAWYRSLEARVRGYVEAAEQGDAA